MIRAHLIYKPWCQSILVIIVTLQYLVFGSVRILYHAGQHTEIKLKI